MSSPSRFDENDVPALAYDRSVDDDSHPAPDADAFWSPAGILADLDGTLVDSVASSRRAWTAFARRHRLDEEETHRIAMGRPTRETIALLAPTSDREGELERIDRDEIGDVGSVVAYPGARELLEGPLPVAIVTSGSSELATARLRGAGLEPPAVMVTADSIERGKPHPEPFLLGACGLGLEPRRCLVLEDAPSGIESAFAAGMPVIALRTTHSDRELGQADAVLDTLAAALERIAPFGAG